MDKDYVLRDIDSIQSMASCGHMIDSNRYENERKGRVEFGILGGTTASHIGSNIVDVESELYGMSRVKSVCSEFLYQPPISATYQQRTNGLKPVDPPVIDYNPRHLSPINFYDVPAIEKQMGMKFDR